ncbi:MAG TPA: metalloregulator ArsR/SmtB family transcription factor [Ferrovibrio sp.]|jgi:DNA-binding transcriptional ArsR family regulator|uniref:ArsR/SmtB family transcription factor n=1 Tax=Ferrovibrio sp. TaxID=1917215 RepID=UPI002ED2EF85
MLELGKLKDHHVAQLTDMFRLLGDPSRLRLVTTLCNGEAAASVAAAMSGLSPQLASHHLRLLRAARLVKAERKGKRIYYALADEHVRRMLEDMIDHVVEPHRDPAGVENGERI